MSEQASLVERLETEEALMVGLAVALHDGGENRPLTLYELSTIAVTLRKAAEAIAALEAELAIYKPKESIDKGGTVC
jgi:hypothetical protein